MESVINIIPKCCHDSSITASQADQAPSVLVIGESPLHGQRFQLCEPRRICPDPRIHHWIIMFGSSYPCCHLCGRVQHLTESYLLKRWSCWMAPLSRCFFCFWKRHWGCWHGVPKQQTAPPVPSVPQEDPGAPPNESGPGRKSGATGKRGKSSRKARFFMGGHFFEGIKIMNKNPTKRSDHIQIMILKDG